MTRAILSAHLVPLLRWTSPESMCPSGF